MRYLVRAKVRPDQEAVLLQAIEDGTLGQGSIAGDEYLRDMAHARLIEQDGLNHQLYTIINLISLKKACIMSKNHKSALLVLTQPGCYVKTTESDRTRNVECSGDA